MRILIASCISMRKHLDQFEASNFGDLINDMTKKLKWKQNLCQILFKFKSELPFFDKFSKYVERFIVGGDTAFLCFLSK